MICAPLDLFPFPSTGDDVYDMDWSEWLAGATIVSAVWSVDAVGALLVTLHTQSLENALTTARTWVRGLNAGGGTAYVSAKITASDGRVWAETWQFAVCDPV